MWMSRVTHMNESFHIWMSHVTRVNESCHTCEWVMSYIWMSQVTHMNESCHTWMSRVRRTNESCHTCEWVMSHMDESCQTYEWVVSHMWMKHTFTLTVWMRQIVTTVTRLEWRHDSLVCVTCDISSHITGVKTCLTHIQCNHCWLDALKSPITAKHCNKLQHSNPQARSCHVIGYVWVMSSLQSYD